MIDKLLYPDNFANHQNELINAAIITFNLKKSPPSLEGVKKIDSFINAKPNLKIDKYFYSQVLAYLGRVMIDNLPEGKWHIINRKDDNNISEPYIISKNKLYNPFFLFTESYTKIYLKKERWLYMTT